MSLNIGVGQKYANTLTVWEVEDKGANWASGKASSSRKDKRITEGSPYINTSWFVRFVGDAHDKALELEKGQRIEILSGYVAQEPYMKGDVKTWPTAPQIVIFDFNVLEPRGGASGMDSAPARASDDDDDESEIPF